MSADVIIIRGAPGVGKSSIAKHLTSRLGTGVAIEVDKVRAMIVNVDWTDTRTHINAIIAATSLVLQYHAQGYRPIILVDTLCGGTLGYVTDQLATIPYIVFSLIASNDVLKSRILMRNSDFMDYERSFWVNQLIVDSAPPHNHTLDTSVSSLDKLCDHITACL